MPSIYYMNQSAPFWDFIAGLEEQGRNHPFFSAYAGGNREPDSDNAMEDGAWGWGPFPFRGRQGSAFPSGNAAAGERAGPQANAPADATAGEKGEGDDTAGEGPYHSRERHHRHRRHGHGHGCGRFGKGRGPWGRGGWGGWAGAAQNIPIGIGPWNLGNFANFLQTQFEGPGDQATRSGPDGQTQGNGDFKPAVDVFDTETSFVVHVSLPGAKKEDIGVNWDSERSELIIAGVIYRPGDEDFLKTLSMEERKVGPFERKLRLGTLANPAQVDVDGITAKLEDGLLRVEVPKLDKDYVEVKKVDVE